MKDLTAANWERVKLGELCKIARGGSPRPIKKFVTTDPDGVNWIKIGDAHVGGRFIESTKEKITRDGISRSRFVEPGALLLSNSMSFGRPYILKTSGCIHDGWLVLEPDYKRVHQDFLYHILGAPETFQQFDSLAAGSTVRNLNIGLVESVSIPLPPLEEQQRIVTVLDEAFDGLARARAHVEANLQNAQELFESYAKSAFQPHEASENKSEATTVGTVCDIQSGAGFPLKYQGRTSGEYPFYKVSDMNLPGNEWELHEANHYISEDVRLELHARLFPEGSIVFPKVGGAIATNKKRVIRAVGCVDNNVMGLIPDESKVVSAYIHEWLRAFDIYEFSNKANPPSITQGTVSGWPLRVPSRDEQLHVVATAAALRAQTESLRECYEARLQDLEDLRQSLLQKAFAGELT